MVGLQKESNYTPSFRQQELHELKERLTRDESRMDIISMSLMERNLIDTLKETDDLIQEWHNLNQRVEQNKTRLAQLKSPSELTEEDKDRMPKAWHPYERSNIKY
ncbi:MAG: hypothetical protein RR415_11770 [Ruthenibacterium sp.]